MQSHTVIAVIHEWPRACPAKLLHVSARAEDFSNIVAEFAYVRPALTANLEKNVPSIHLNEVDVVNASGPQLPLDRSPQGRSLVNQVFKFFQNASNMFFFSVAVKFHHANIFFATVKKRLNHFR